MTKIKLIHCRLLLHILNEESISLCFNKYINREAFSKIAEASYPITQSTLHSYANADAIRCNIVLNDKGDTVLLDIPVGRFNDLPEMVI